MHPLCREHSLLENPLTPVEVTGGQVVVVPQGADPGKADGMRVVSVPK